jgi:hypothetical protein
MIMCFLIMTNLCASRFGCKITSTYLNPDQICTKTSMYVSCGLEMVLTFIQFNMLRSACKVGRLRRLHRWQTSKLNQSVDVQHVAINNHTSYFHHTICTHLCWAQANSDMPLFRKPACFNSWTTTQKTSIWMISYSQVGQFFHQRNSCVTVYFFFTLTFCTSICNCNTVHLIVCPRLNILTLKNISS